MKLAIGRFGSDSPIRALQGLRMAITVMATYESNIRGEKTNTQAGLWNATIASATTPVQEPLHAVSK